MSLKSRESLQVNLRKIPCAMTIAGSDSGGGAGIEADLKTFSALGVFGTCAITAVTAQNTLGVFEVFPVPPALVKKQIEAVMDDIPVGAAKTGMLYSAGIMEAVASSIDKYGLRVVVDPVFRAGTGDPLILEEDKEALVRLVVPRAYVLTPNVSEAEAMTNMHIESLEDMKEAAQGIIELGAEAVVLKGGHLNTEEEKVYDLFYHGGTFKLFEKPRAKVQPHGAGCIYSAAVAAYLARGMELTEAVEKAEEFTGTSIEHALRVGAGRIPVNPMADLYNRAEMHSVLEDVARAVETFEAHPELLSFIAEVGTQVGMALPHSSSESDVAAIEGRIVRFRGKPKAVGSARFGVSQHIASIVLTVMRYDPGVRAALNLHYDPGLVEAFRRAGFKISSFDRSLEPAELKTVEGRSLSWGVAEAIESLGEVPDVIFDRGEVGKEPMIRVLGRSATDVVEKTLMSVKFFASAMESREKPERMG